MEKAQNLNTYCHHLDLGFSIDPSLVSRYFDKFKGSTANGSVPIDKQDIPETFLRIVDKCGYAVSGLCFYMAPNKARVIHTDTDANSNMAKINFCFDRHGDSEMVWYDFVGDSTQVTLRESVIGNRYNVYDLAGCVEVWKDQIRSPSLINAGVPHNVFNHSNQPRLSFSYTLLHKQTNQRVEWCDAVQQFKQYLLL